MYLNIELVRLLPYHPVIGWKFAVGKSLASATDRCSPCCLFHRFDGDLFASVSACLPTNLIYRMSTCSCFLFIRSHGRQSTPELIATAL